MIVSIKKASDQELTAASWYATIGNSGAKRFWVPAAGAAARAPATKMNERLEEDNMMDRFE